MRFFLSFIFLIPLFSSLSLADSSVPPEHRSHCRKWEKGACVEGELTDLAKSIHDAEKVKAATATTSVCKRICDEACPSCGKCSLCSFCWVYNSESCNNVAYFTDPDTCTEKKTESCCDLCEAHCGDNGACSEKEYCNGGDKTTSTIVKCIEKTQGEMCKPCAEYK